MPKDLFQGVKINDTKFVLNGPDHHHCSRVTRHKIADQILVSDFDGSIYIANIQEISADSTFLNVESIYSTEAKSPKISIAISPTQQMDRFEWFVEKAVECGVSEIIPIQCERTENTRIKKERLEKIILASAKQSLRANLTICHDLMPFQKLINQSDISQRFICHCENNYVGNLGVTYNPNEDVLVLIGPAGDFTKNEINLSKEKSFLSVDLGNFRLRTETAGIVASTILAQKKTINEKRN